MTHHHDYDEAPRLVAMPKARRLRDVEPTGSLDDYRRRRDELHAADRDYVDRVVARRD